MTIDTSNQPIAFGAYAAAGILSTVGATGITAFAVRAYKHRKNLVQKWQDEAIFAQHL